jgi:hypothetical protein
MHQEPAAALGANTAQLAALLALQRALSRATELGLLDELSGFINPDVINRFCDGVNDMEAKSHVDLPLSNWTVIQADGHHFTCQAVDIHHAIEQSENADPDKGIATAFEGKCESQIQVVHWDATRYGREGFEGDGSTPFVLGAWDRREASGQFSVTMAPAEGDVDDILYALFEVNRLPGSKDDTQCVHIHFDSENLAFSVFKQCNKIILRPENGVTVLNTTLPSGETALIVQ